MDADDDGDVGRTTETALLVGRASAAPEMFSCRSPVVAVGDGRCAPHISTSTRSPVEADLGRRKIGSLCQADRRGAM